MEILQVKNLGFTYTGNRTKALDDINFSISAGSINLLIGATGSGKSTLLRLLKRQLSPAGQTQGEIIFDTVDILNKSSDLLSLKIGYVGQDPELQIVTDKVWSELVFGLESMGLSRDEIHRRAAEFASYFGIQEWFDKSTDELSGGQKQILNLASVMITEPELLILDEPTSQLDPISSSDFMSTLIKLNMELGTTILIAEHRTEDLFPISDKLLIVDRGKLIFCDTPRCACTMMKGHDIYDNFPTAAKIWSMLDIECECPISVKDGITFLEKHYYPDQSEEENTADKSILPAVIQASNIWFRYSKNDKDILKGANLTVRQGEIFSILGGNGSGKTTILNLVSGLKRPYKGKIKINGKNILEYKNNSLYKGVISYLPQDPKLLFIKDTVADDLYELAGSLDIERQQQDKLIDETIQLFEIKDLINIHPYDLSGGERQKCALAKLMLTDPAVFLLDEPTKGMDAAYKKKLGIILKLFKEKGKTVLITTHDIEFAAAYSDKCALLFNGIFACVGKPSQFFSGNHFYTTASARISRRIFNNTILFEDVVKRCKKAKCK